MSASAGGAPPLAPSGVTLSLRQALSPAHHATISTDRRFIAGTTKAVDVQIWNADTCADIGVPMCGHTNTVLDVCFNKDATLLASGGHDRSIRLWSTIPCQGVGTPLVGHTDDVRSVCFSRDGARLYSGGRDGTVRMWDVTTQQQVGEVWTHDRTPDCKCEGRLGDCVFQGRPFSVRCTLADGHRRGARRRRLFAVCLSARRSAPRCRTCWRFSTPCT